MTALATDDWLDGLDEGVVKIDEDRVTFVNASAARLLGVEARWAVGRSVIEVVRDHRLEAAWAECRSVKATIFGRHVEAVPLGGVGLALRDVTVVRTARETARDLLAVLSHELRTPVTTIRATLDALAYDDLDPDLRASFVERACDESDRLVRLLDDLTVDVTPPRSRSVELADLAARMQALVAEQATIRGVTVRVSVGKVVAWADPDKLLQVLLNLTENAILHGPRDQEVVVAATLEGDLVHLCVRDRGPVVEADVVERWFAPHVRGGATSARGTGLGLYIVRSIVERWGGKAWGAPWSTVVGEVSGLEFCVTVPARRGASPEALSVALES